MLKVRSLTVAFTIAVAATISTAALAHADQTRQTTTHIYNSSGTDLRLAQVGTVGDVAPFVGTEPQIGAVVANLHSYRYTNEVSGSRMETATVWRMGTATFLKVNQKSFETPPTCEFAGPDEGDYKCEISKSDDDGVQVEHVQVEHV